MEDARFCVWHTLLLFIECVAYSYAYSNASYKIILPAHNSNANSSIRKRKRDNKEP